MQNATRRADNLPLRNMPSPYKYACTLAAATFHIETCLAHYKYACTLAATTFHIETCLAPNTCAGTHQQLRAHTTFHIETCLAPNTVQAHIDNRDVPFHFKLPLAHYTFVCVPMQTNCTFIFPTRGDTRSSASQKRTVTIWSWSPEAWQQARRVPVPSGFCRKSAIGPSGYC